MSGHLTEAIAAERARLEEEHQARLEILDTMESEAQKLEGAQPTPKPVTSRPKDATKKVPLHNPSVGKSYRLPPRPERLKEIVGILSAADGPIRSRDLRNKVSSSTNMFKQDIDRLIREGKVVRKGQTTSTTYQLGDGAKATPVTLASNDDFDNEVVKLLEKTPNDPRLVSEIASALVVEPEKVVGSLNRLRGKGRVHEVRLDQGGRAFGVPRGSEAGLL